MKKPTSKDVAKLANVSQATVSMILNKKDNVSFAEDTVEKVLWAARQLNYGRPVIAKTSPGERQKLIALFTPTMSNPYYPMLNQAVEEIAIPLGYNVLVCNSYRNKEIERYYLELLTDNFLVDGIVYAISPTFPELVRKISTFIPVVIVGDKDDRLEIDTVSLNSYKGGALIAEHLITLGHTHIALITTPLENVSVSRQQRFRGIQETLAKHGLDQHFIVKAPASIDEHEGAGGIYEIESGYTLTMELLNEHTSVSAIIGVNDITAGGIMKALSEKGYKVPQQMSVCGFDNIFISSILQPPLTTIDHRVQHRAKTGVTLLIEKIERLTETTPSAQLDDPGVYKIEYEPQLIVRNSTGPVKK